MIKAYHHKYFTLSLIAFFSYCLPSTVASQEYSWKIADSAYQQVLIKFECIDSQYCCGVATGGPTPGNIRIVCTSDGGVSWSTIWADSARPGHQPPFLRIWDIALTPDHIMAAMDSGIMLRLRIDERKVIRTTIDTNAGRLPSFVSIQGENHGYFITHRRESDTIQPILYFTSDGGQSWEPRRITLPGRWHGEAIDGFQALQRPGEFLIYLHDSPDNKNWERLVLISRDTGRTFMSTSIEDPLLPDSSQFTLSAIIPIGKEHVYLLGTAPQPSGLAGVLLVLDQKTLVWEKRFMDQISDFPATSFSNAHFRDSIHGIAGGVANIYRTSDGGKSWSADSIESHRNAFEFYAYSFGDKSGIATSRTAGYFLLYDEVSSVPSPFVHEPMGNSGWVLSMGSGDRGAVIPTYDIEAGPISLHITDIAGKNVHSETLRSHDGRVQVSLNLLPGLYFARLVGKQGGTSIGRIVVIR